MSMVWCKDEFQRQRSNFDDKCVRFKGYGAKQLSKEFLNKGWGLRGLNKLFEKLQKNWQDGKMKRQH